MLNKEKTVSGADILTMRIIEDVKLDFDDVLITPKQSLLSSRAEVSLVREFKFLHSEQKLECVPIVAANMAAVSSLDVARVLASHDMMTALPKGSDLDIHLKHQLFVTFGADTDEIQNFLKDQTVPYICLDVANGYMDKFRKVVSKAREIAPESVILAGNVCTPEATERLIMDGADIVKVGIGGGSGCTTRLKTGCFVAGTLINTGNGLKPIELIDAEDVVLSHDGTYQKVIDTHRLKSKDNLLEINGISCTSNHEFYVIKKEDAEKINDNNIHDYALWVEAKDLSEEYLLIEIEE